MKLKKIILALACLSSPLYAENDQQLQRQINLLQKQTQQLQTQLTQLQQQLKTKKAPPHQVKGVNSPHTKHSIKGKLDAKDHYHDASLTVHSLDVHPESIRFYPTALVADNQVVTYIAGTPVVSSPYLGARPAFDGSDYIVNISSINRDIRLMEQRRRLYKAYEDIGYPAPKMPIIAISGKSEPQAVVNRSSYRQFGV
jgi:hypothetical protein